MNFIFRTCTVPSGLLFQNNFRYINRRLFLQIPLAASISGVKWKNLFPNRPEKGIKVKDKEDRFGDHVFFLGSHFYCKVSGKDTGGDLCIYDSIRMQQGGPPLHFHHSQDE